MKNSPRTTGQKDESDRELLRNEFKCQFFDPLRGLISNCLLKNYSQDFNEFVQLCLSDYDTRVDYESLKKTSFYKKHLESYEEDYETLKLYLDKLQ